MPFSTGKPPDLQQYFLKSKNLLAQSLVRQLFERKASGKIENFPNATPVSTFQGAHPSVKVLFKGYLVHKVEFVVFNTMDKICYRGWVFTEENINS